MLPEGGCDAGSTSRPLQILDRRVCACLWLSMGFDVVFNPKSVRIAVASVRLTNARAASKELVTPVTTRTTSSQHCQMRYLDPSFVLLRCTDAAAMFMFSGFD